MEVILHTRFKKEFKKLPLKIRKNYKERIDLFMADPFHQLLNNHSVAPEYPGWRSINITGDFRVLYKPITETKVIFTRIGTHSQLYKK